MYARVRADLPGLLALLLLAAGLPASAAAAPLDAFVRGQLAHAGPSYGAVVLDTTTGRTLAAVNPDVPRIPASVNKLYTTSTALLTFGADATLPTTVLGSGALDDATGAWNGSLYLHGGGDPTLGSAAFTRRLYGTGTTMAQLAANVRAAGVRSVTGGVYGDESWFDLRRGDPDNGYALDLTDLGSPLGALLYDRGLAHEDGSAAVQARPAKFAAQRLVAELRRRGVHVDPARVGQRTAPVGARELARVASPTIATLARLTLVPSDNFLAEMLIKGIGARFGGAGSTAAGAAVVRRTLEPIGIAPTLVDGSGLSRSDRTSPRQVVLLLAAMRDAPGFRGALAVAGRTGTLDERMRHSSAQDRCQAKTGTLHDVSALAGFCRTPNGHLLAFAYIENFVYTPYAKELEDRVTIQLARQRPAGVAPPPASTPSPEESGGAGATT